ncbi:hypothetical protein IWQ56_005611, partial [Coemansia nantahalensis]
VNTSLQGAPPRPISTVYVRMHQPDAPRSAPPEESPRPLRQTFTTPSERQLHAIDESSELADYAGGGGGAAGGKQTNIRRNLLSGFRRVAKA